MGYGQAYGFQSAGAGLREIGRLLMLKRIEEERRKGTDSDRQYERDMLRAQHQMLPDATTLEGVLGDERYGREGSMGPAPTEAEFRAAAQGAPVANANQIANAANEDVPIRFRAPPPAEFEVPGVGQEKGRTFQMEERAPVMLPSGVVLAPRAEPTEEMVTARDRAMQENDYLKAGLTPEQAKQSMLAPGLAARLLAPTKETPRNIDPLSEEGIAADLRREKGRAQYARPPAARPISATEAMAMLQDAYYGPRPGPVGKDGKPTAEINAWDPRATPEWRVGAQRELMAGRPMPKFPVSAGTGASVFGGPQPDRSPGWSVRGARPAMGGAVPMATPTPATPADSAPAFGLSMKRVEQVRPRVQQGSVEGPAAPTPAAPTPARAAPSAVPTGQDPFSNTSRTMLADEWERLVESGFTPDSATAMVRRKYNLGAGR